VVTPYWLTPVWWLRTSLRDSHRLTHWVGLPWGPLCRLEALAVQWEVYP
jgi:hypothetical protein